MARTASKSRIDSKTKRLGLPLGQRVTDTIGEGRYLIYRRPMNGAAGTWTARWRDKDTSKFTNAPIGEADDLEAADGSSILTYEQAKEWASSWYRRCVHRALEEAEGITHKPTENWTVRDVIEFYIEQARKKRKTAQNAENDYGLAKVHILAHPMAEVLISKLSTGRIEKWHQDLATAGRIITGRKWKEGDEVRRADVDPEDLVALKRRKSSANRILSILKAALNFAVTQKKIEPDHTPWLLVQPFKGAKSSRIRFLSVAEQQKLVAACTPEFRQLVCAALYTGARYSELAGVLVRDVDLANGAVWVDGKGQDDNSRWVFLTEEGERFFRQAVAGKNYGDHVFQHTSKRRSREGNHWMKSDAKGPMKAALKAAGVEHMSFHELRHTYASMLIARGVSLKVVADQLGHADTRMVEEHYGHLAHKERQNLVRKAGVVQRLQVSRPNPLRSGVTETVHVVS